MVSYLSEDLQAVVKDVKDFVNNAFQLRANSSLLLIGPRGSGKSTVLRTVLEDLDVKPTVVYLHGLLHADDDRIALATMARQLSVHPEKYVSASTPILLDLINRALEDGAERKTKFLFVLDDFDSFALRPKQTVLYCLLNLLQGKNIDSVLLGMTIRIDAAELLEKRVKSRFSQRIVIIPRPESVDEISNIVRHHVHTISGQSSPVAMDSTAIQHQLDRDRSVFPFVVSAAFDGANLDRGLTLLRCGDVVGEVLLGLSTLELALLISFRRLSMRKGIDSWAFDAVYEEYSSMHLGEGREKQRLHHQPTSVSMSTEESLLQGSDLYTRVVAWKAWSRLLDAELLEASASHTRARAEAVQLTVELDAIREAMERHDGVGTTLRAWGSSWIT